MKRILLLLPILLCGAFNSYSQRIPFSDSTVISLITCSPGEEVYAKFGHTAVRLKDEINDVDIVFNYGIFDFNTHNFYLKFVKGETDYKLAAYDFIYFLPEYIERNSTVWEQELNLTIEEKQKLIELLLTNYEPQNRVYRYNFIYDNCSTRARDIIVKAINGKVEYHLVPDERPFREWVRMYVGTGTWVMLGIDMIFGEDSDKDASRRESMFLPEVLMNEFQHAIIQGANQRNSRTLISDYHTLNDRLPEEEKKLPLIISPIVICSLLLLIGIALIFFRHKLRKTCKIFDTILYAIIGVMGLIAFYLTFMSLHPMVKNNFNLFWLNPLFLVVAITQWIRPLRAITLLLQILNLLFLLIALIISALSIQYVNFAFIPLILLLFVRTIVYIRNRLKRNSIKKRKRKHEKQSSF